MLGVVGFVVAFFGYAGWQDPAALARHGSAAMHEADDDTQRVYGRLVAGLFGGLGLLLMGAGLYGLVTSLPA